MNIALWVLQILLAVHTVIGAVWKFSNSEQVVPSLSAIPHGLWMALIVFEVFCSVGLILPAINKRFGKLAAFGAIGVAAEMLLFCAVHIYSGYMNYNELIYWLVVAAVCAFIAYGRLVLKKIG